MRSPRKPRIYHPYPLESYTLITLESETSQHLTRVLRMGIDDEIIVFNGQGGEYTGIIQTAQKKVQVKITQYDDRNPESPLTLHLGQGLARNDRMDFIIQKATELGVTHITPLITATSVVKLDDKKIEKKMEHWQNIAISAAQQSGRTHLPIIAKPLRFEQFISQPFEGKNILFEPLAMNHLKMLAPNPKAIRLLIGPESGLNESEVSRAMNNQFEAYTLGPRILRTETASLAALSVLQLLYGDW